MMSKKLISLLFIVLFSATFMLSVADAAKVAKKAKKTRKSATELIEEVLDILGDFGGDTVSQLINEFTANMKQTSSLLKSLADDKTIDSVNHLIRSSISSLGEAARQAAKNNNTSDSVVASDFSEFLDSFKTTLLKKLKGKSDFSFALLPHIENTLPLMNEGLLELYDNVTASTGFSLTFGMLSQGTSLLSMFERPEYVSKDTFKNFTNFPDEIRHQFETIVDELVNNYIDPTQLEMGLNMARMYASSFASTRGEKDEL